jgi:hypothetical protein
MWARLDDALIDHQKIADAGALIGKNGRAIAIGFYAVGLMWSNKHLSDGHLSLAQVKAFNHVENPLAVADALVQAGLWQKNGNGFVIHDFDDFNPSAAEVKRKRREDRDRKRLERK